MHLSNNQLNYTMRIIKNAVFGVFVMGSAYLLSRYRVFDSNTISTIIIVFCFSLFFFNIAVRRILWFRPYFISKFNLLTSTFKIEKEYDFEKDILFHKIIEVLTNSKYRVVKYDEAKGLILATSRMSWKSWGENIYIKLDESGDKVNMNFCSTTFWGIYSMGRNEDNYYNLINSFNESLII